MNFGLFPMPRSRILMLVAMTVTSKNGRLLVCSGSTQVQVARFDVAGRGRLVRYMRPS
ncbi:hypothetical protein [Mycolicibacterium sp.]|uniref:hypothetical protein n=1 Tax=Mycolicibacterium sp. TaxID=2320850 RepID=UPI0037CA7FE5